MIHAIWINENESSQYPFLILEYSMDWTCISSKYSIINQSENAQTKQSSKFEYSVYEIIFSLSNIMKSANVTGNLYWIPWVGCPVWDLKILWQLFWLANVQQRSCDGEYEKFAELCFTTLVFPIFNTSWLTWNHLRVLYKTSINFLVSSSQQLLEIRILVSLAYIIALQILSTDTIKS